MNDMVVFQEPRQLTAADIRAQVNLVQEVMRAVMQGPSKENPDGVHYGKIPGTPKPTLFKPGADKLAQAFRIAVSFPSVEDLSTAEVVRYRVTSTGTHQTSNIVMGSGMGECSSAEEKYKWRKAASRKEFDTTPEDRRRTKYGYNRLERKEFEIQQVRTEPADLANTVLKMACKRAQVAMILNVTAASDLFTQDIEDLPEELRPGANDTPEQQRQPVDMPRSKSEPSAAQDQAAPKGQAKENEETGSHAPGPAAAAAPKTAAPDVGPSLGDQAPTATPAAAVPDKPMLPGQLKILRAKMANANPKLTDADLIAKFGPIEGLKFGMFADVQKWTQGAE